MKNWTAARVLHGMPLGKSTTQVGSTGWNTQVASQRERGAVKRRRRFTPIVAAVLPFFVLALGGCVFLENIANRRAPPDTRVMLKLNDQLVVDRITRRTKLGASLEQYKCGQHQLMVCRDWGSELICRCEVWQ